MFQFHLIHLEQMDKFLDNLSFVNGGLFGFYLGSLFQLRTGGFV
jgi:hypothetical protein